MPSIRPIKSRVKNELDIIPDKMRIFCYEYIIDRDQTRAAMEAGYTQNPKNAQTRGSKLLQDPRCQRLIGKLTNKLEKRATYKAQDVLRYIHTAMFFDPRDYFQVGSGKQGWTMDEEQYAALPKHIACLIQDVEKQVFEFPDGSRKTSYRIRFVEKGKMAELAARHQLDQKIRLEGQLDVNMYNWNTLAVQPTANIITTEAVKQALQKRIEHQPTGNGHYTVDELATPGTVPE